MTHQTMTIEKIETESGYAEIKVSTVEIADKFEIILHRVYPNEILNLVCNLESTLKLLDLENHNDFIRSRITSVKNKIKTLLLNRQKRGLINLGGTAFRWMFGIMDNDDRLDIENHLNIVDQNNHNLIRNSNQQVTINDNFNKTFIQIKNIIETDRTKVLHRLNRLNLTEMQIISENAFLEQMFKLDYIEKQIEHLQDNIASARLGLLHPNILTDEEINKYHIDFNKLSNIRLAVAKHIDESIIFAIKIPVHNIITSKNLLIPITNSQKRQVDSNIEYIVRDKGRMLTYIEGKSLKELPESKNCIKLENCKFVNKDREEISLIEDNIIIVNNIEAGKLKSTCDERILLLKGNYFINFNNCTLKINNREFSNKLKIFTEKFVIPNYKNFSNNDKEPEFDKIVLHNVNNIENIKELKYHKIANYSLGILTIVIISIFIIYIYYKQKNIKIKIKSRIQENPKTKEGGVRLESNPNIIKINSLDEIIEKYSHNT